MDTEKTGGAVLSAEQPAKKPYTKPMLEFIPLNAEELTMIRNSCLMGGDLSEEQKIAIKECIDRNRQS